VEKYGPAIEFVPNQLKEQVKQELGIK
jgi:hypothetical protein